MPTEVVSSYKVTVVPVSQEIVKVGVVSFVMLSEFEEPVSEASSRFGAPVAEIDASIVTERFDEADEIFPAPASCLAFME